VGGCIGDDQIRQDYYGARRLWLANHDLYLDGHCKIIHKSAHKHFRSHVQYIVIMIVIEREIRQST